MAIDGDGLTEELAKFLDSHTGDARRIGHVGIGLNPRLPANKVDLGWPIVDEHIYGRIFVSLGENRYLSGQNASSLNIDFAVAGAELYANDRRIDMRRHQARRTASND